jgi:hypothetical protein
MISGEAETEGQVVMALAKAKPAESLYETDTYAWAERQAKALLEHRAGDLDWENLADEVRSLGGSEKREIESRLSVLLTHLLKAAFQPEKWKGGWQATIKVQRIELAAVLARNPSLRNYPAEVLAGRYEIARLAAVVETGLAERDFPEECPFTLEDVLDPAFFAGRPSA